MCVNLIEGQGISLRNDDGLQIDNLRVKLGWNVPRNPSKMWFANFFEQSVVECNAYMLMCQESSIIEDEDVISYCNPEHESKSVRYLGKCLDNKGRVSELMSINLEKIPRQYDTIVFMADIDRTNDENQNFGMIKEPYIHITDDDRNEKFCHYDLAGTYDGMVSVIFGVMFRGDNSWKFMALGEGSNNEEFGYMLKQIQQFEQTSSIAT